MSPSTVTEERISVPKDLYKIRSGRWLLDLALDWGVIILTFVAFAHWKSWYLVPVAALIIGARMHGLGLLVHDATHRVALKNQQLNDLLGEFFIMYPLFFVMEDGYRPWHFEHHRHLGTPKDPELADYRDFAPYSGKVTWRKIALIFCLDMLGLGIIGLLKFVWAVFPFRQPWRYLGPLSFWVLFFLATWHLHALWVFYLWFWSVITGFWAVFRIRTWTEHVGVEPCGKNTSHRFRVGPVERFLFFPHNTFCHYEHHKWPQVPYYNLPAVRKMDQSRPVLPLSGLFPAT